MSASQRKITVLLNEEERRQFQAEVAMRYCEASPRRAEEMFGWGRDAVNKGLHWNGTLLTSIETALHWARSMTWRGVSPVVHLLDRVYNKGVRVSRAAFRPIAARLERSANLAKWSLVIHPHPR